ncbi:MAG: ABC transporter ATP-binding protein [Planctomycetota bacterium]
MASVRLSGLGKRFGDQWVVRGVDLEIEDGEFCVLVGPSGCGKSTTLRLVAGLDEPSEGGVTIGGRSVDDLPPHRRDVAFVFQGYALYPHLDVRANLAFGLERRRAHGGRLRALVGGAYRARRRAESEAIAARVAEVARQLELEELLDRRPAALSGGQQQRVALGRALVREPAVFLLDEPLSNLDARLRGETRRELRALHDRVRGTFVHVTHDQEEAMELADRLVVMAEGRVQQIGRPTEVHALPANRFVAGFVGQPNMNFVEGEVGPDGFTGPGVVARELRSATARAAVLGVRPSDLDVVAPDAAALGTFRCTDVRPFGDHTDVEFARDDAVLLARLRGTRVPRVGDEAGLAAERLHLFEPGPFGARIGGSPT